MNKKNTNKFSIKLCIPFLLLIFWGSVNVFSAPVISGTQVSYVRNYSAQISWTTNEASTTQVDYGLTGVYGSSTIIDANLVLTHKVFLSGLTSGKIYHYRLRSRNDSGEEVLSEDGIFTTLSIPVDSPEYYSQWENSLPTGSDFFPIAVWLQSPHNAGTFKNMGINTYIGLWEGPTEAQLSALQGQGIHVVAAQNTVGLTSVNNGILKSWMHQDEPDNAQPNGSGGYTYCVAPDVLVGLYNNWKLNDQTRPVMLNLGKGVSDIGWYGRWYLDNVGGKDYSVASGNYGLYYTEASKAADILSYDIYPVTDPDESVSGKLEFVAAGVKNLINWSGGEKPVWNCIETAHINSQILPTVSQIRSEVWMSIIAGSRGIIYFVHEWVPSFSEPGILRYPEIVSGVTAINAQIKSLAPVLNSPSITNIVQVNSSNPDVPIDFMVKNYNNETYLFTAAMRNTAVTATFTITNGISGNVEEISENRQIIPGNNQFQDNFSGYGIHIYKFISGPVPNQAPVISSLSDITKYQGEKIEFDVTVTDINNQDTLTLRSEGMPENSSLIKTGNRIWKFVWQTDFSDTGTIPITLTANDGQEDSEPVSINIILNEVSTNLQLTDHKDWN